MNPIQTALHMLDRDGKRRYFREYEKARMRDTEALTAREVPEDMRERVIGLWQSRDYLVTAWATPGIVCRLTINRRELTQDGGWKEGIDWETMQSIKRLCGYGDKDAVEVFPNDANVVNVARMRHLWVLVNPLPFGLHTG